MEREGGGRTAAGDESEGLGGGEKGAGRGKGAVLTTKVRVRSVCRLFDHVALAKRAVTQERLLRS